MSEREKLATQFGKLAEMMDSRVKRYGADYVNEGDTALMVEAARALAASVRSVEAKPFAWVEEYYFEPPEQGAGWHSGGIYRSEADARKHAGFRAGGVDKTRVVPLYRGAPATDPAPS